MDSAYTHISDWIKQNGKEKMQQALNDYDHLSKNIARKYSYYHPHLEKDLEAEAQLGLMLALTKYKNDKGTALPTYLYYWMRARVLRRIESEAKYSKLRSLDAEVGENNMVLSDVVSSSASSDVLQHLDKEITSNYIESCINSLPEKQRYVIKQRFLVSPRKSFTELAAEMKMSKPYIKKLELNGLDSLRSFLKFKTMPKLQHSAV